MIDRILVVDDEFLIRQLLEETASRRGLEVVTAGSGEEAVAILEEQEFQMAFVDMKMGRMSGMDVLKFARQRRPAMLTVIMTAYGAVDTAIAAMKTGAFDFIIKPFSPDQMDILVEKGRLWLQLHEREHYFRAEMTGGDATAAADGTPELSGRAIGDSPEMCEINRLIRRVAPTGATVLVTGESGTGKELIASEIHRLSDPDGTRPYIRMNCAAVPENLLESELFGHEKGAFTGAVERRIGRFELADGGTLLLDEIGEIKPAMQAKLLRVLQESEFERVGGNKTVKVQVRVIASTNRDLNQEVAAGNFREDLFYRLNVFPIPLPPLRQRRRDAVKIARHYLDLQGKKLGRSLQLDDTATALIAAYPWPGNIRELQNVIERIAILEDGPVISAVHFPADMRRNTSSAPTDANTDAASTAIFDMRQIERRTIAAALRETAGNRTRAAALLGLSVRTLRNKLNEYRNDPELAVPEAPTEAEVN
ncbi:MAG: sigma-54 dependent transcriptional regulator [Victivallales bacterium]|nr:sigma-54 dependent transcriptional regulator [Victivallales bacterium]